MKIFHECIPCFLRQTIEASRLATDNEDVQGEILREVLRELSTIPFSLTPPHMGQRIHRIIREVSKGNDPYRGIKRRLNDLAMGIYPWLKERVSHSGSPPDTALRLSLAGNILDCGPPDALDEESFDVTIETTLSQELSIDDTDQLWGEVAKAHDILFLGDNAGEIVLDRLLVEELPQEKVTFVVRGHPVINDATVEDAEHVGLTDLVEVMDNGSDAPGTILETCSSTFLRRYETADLIISKGQGNYETLSDQRRNIFFLLTVKCPIIARDIQGNVGDMVVKGQRNLGAKTTLSNPVKPQLLHHPVR